MTMVMLTQGSRRERKKAAVQAKILETAIDLFSRYGIGEVTVDQIAEAADIGKGTLYNYFETKESVVVAFMVDLERKVQAKVVRLRQSQGNLESILTEFIRFQMRMKRPYHQFVRVFLGQMFTQTNQFLPYMVEMQKAIDPPLQTLFKGLQDRSMISETMPISDLVLVFKTVHLGLTALWAVEGPPFRQTERILAQEIHCFCEGLRAKTL